MSEIGKLICGENVAEGIAKNSLGQLSAAINGFSQKAIGFLDGESSDEMLSFGPFCARVLLENSCAALVGRLDPFRMMYLSEFQNQAEYEHGKRAKSSFSWTGDVLPVDEKAGLWNIDYDIPKISRALFSKHLGHIYWKPAVEDMLDHVSSYLSEPELADILSIDPGTYLDECKGKSSQLYSTLSKAVHWEFFSTALVFDEVTVRNSIRETCLLVAHLGLVSHFIPTAFAKLESDQAVGAYIAYRKLIN